MARFQYPSEGANARLAGFGDNLARTVGCKLVDHDPVIAEQRANLAGTFLVEGRQVRLVIESCHHQADRARCIAIAVSARLGFDYDLAARVVDRDVEGRAVLADLAPEHAFDRVRGNQIGDPVAQVMDELGRKELSQRRSDGRLGIERQELAKICREHSSSYFWLVL